MGTLDELLFYKRDPKYLTPSGGLQMDWSEAWEDATWETPRSASACLIIVFGMLVDTKTVRQSTSALSSTEAEVMSLLLMMKAGGNRRNFVGEMVGLEAAELPPPKHIVLDLYSF